MTTKKHFRVLALITVILSFALPQAANASFTDVPKSHKQYEAISALEESGIIKGYTDNTFRPDKTITKAEFIKVVFNHAGYNPPERFHEIPFDDVNGGTWYAPYVKKALDLELIHFNESFPKFLPNQPVNRIDGSKLILPLEGVPTQLAYNKDDFIFEDITSNSAYSHIIKAAQNSGIYLTADTKYFLPQKLLTRGDVAELLYKAELYNGGEFITFSPEEIIGQPYVTDSDLINNPKFPILISVWDKITNEYLNREEISQNELVYSAIDGMVTSLNDQYSVFESPESAQDLQDSLDGNYEGIGTILDVFEGDLIIISVIKDSPAEQAGLKAGDIIKKVDGESTNALNTEEIITKIKGPSGTTVAITVDRDGKTLTFNVKRAEISLSTVFLQGGIEIPDTVGYISISQFTESTGSEFERLMTKTLSNNPEGLILDLRDNPGGYVNSAYEVLDLLLAKGKTLVKMRINGELIPEPSNGPGNTQGDIPVIVLVNKNTASAAEIVAGALQDHSTATLIGETTYGKGTVQEVNIYTDGSLFKLSVAEWLTPNEHNINHLGLTPDIMVTETKNDVLGTTDSQLQKAILEIRSQT